MTCDGSSDRCGVPYAVINRLSTLRLVTVNLPPGCQRVPPPASRAALRVIDTTSNAGRAPVWPANNKSAMAAWRIPFPPYRLQHLVFGWAFDMVDEDDVARTADGFELQAELILERCEDRRLVGRRGALGRPVERDGV